MSCPFGYGSTLRQAQLIDQEMHARESATAKAEAALDVVHPPTQAGSGTNGTAAAAAPSGQPAVAPIVTSVQSGLFSPPANPATPMQMFTGDASARWSARH
jgi:hypothetical protein